MPANTPVFLLGLIVGTSLLVFGLLLGYWLGRKAITDGIDRQKFMSFLHNLSSWTSEYAGDVDRYHSQLAALDAKFRSDAAPPREEMLEMLAQIMQSNRQLQSRLENAEQKLEVQTDQISSYLTEARTDGLTGLHNRRAFDKALDGLFSEWAKSGRSFSVGLIDIDHFKRINDTYGHPAGDAVLKHISGMLQAELRETVCVARYGGEEFAVLSLASGEKTAEALDHLRAAVGRVQVKYDAHVISVTLSAGSAQVEADDKIGKLIRRADEALYAAKLGGRNRVYRHDGAICHLVTKVDPAVASAESAPTKMTESPAEEVETKLTNVRIAERLQRIVQDETRRLVQR